MLKNFTGFKKVYHKNLCKLNSIAKRLSNNSIKQTEKDILIDYYSNLNDLNEMYNDLIDWGISKYKEQKTKKYKRKLKSDSKKIDISITKNLLKEVDKLIYIFDNYSTLSNLKGQNHYILPVEESVPIINPSNDKLALRLDYEYNGSPYISLLELKPSGLATVQKSTIRNNLFKIGDMVIQPLYNFENNKIKSLSIKRNINI